MNIKKVTFRESPFSLLWKILIWQSVLTITLWVVFRMLRIELGFLFLVIFTLSVNILAFLFFVFLWSRKKYVFDETWVKLYKWYIYKNELYIRYQSIKSVNIRKGLICKLFNYAYITISYESWDSITITSQNYREIKSLLDV